MIYKQYRPMLSAARVRSSDNKLVEFVIVVKSSHTMQHEIVSLVKGNKDHWAELEESHRQFAFAPELTDIDLVEQLIIRLEHEK